MITTLNPNEISVEEELLIYKKFVSKLPFGFNYIDEHAQLELHKERGCKEAETKRTSQKSSFTYDLDPRKDIDIEIFEEFLNPILDLVPHHISIIDENGIVTLANQQILDDYKVKREDVIGSHISELLKIPEDQIMSLETLKTGVSIKNKEILDKNYGIINTDLIKDANGNIKRVVATFQFLNKIKEAERKGIAGRIAAGIAHEIRNPLTVVKGFLQIMESRIEEKDADLIKTLLIPEIDRANSIITDFLSISKDVPTVRNEFLINDYIGVKLYNLFQSEIFLNNVVLNLDLSEQLNASKVLINKDEITQVFLNLLKNSIEASNKRPLIIDIKTIDNGEDIIITFTDDGPGISPASIKCIFDPFYTTKDDGTGLGLSVSKKLIEKHGGTMEVESNKNGTTFTITLPKI